MDFGEAQSQLGATRVAEQQDPGLDRHARARTEAGDVARQPRVEGDDGDQRAKLRNRLGPCHVRGQYTPTRLRRKHFRRIWSNVRTFSNYFSPAAEQSENGARSD